jgi:hypothetical protein
MSKKEYYRKSLYCILAIHLSTRFIYIVGGASLVVATLFPVSSSTGSINLACLSLAFLIESYMLHLLNKHEFDIEDAIDTMNGE